MRGENLLVHSSADIRAFCEKATAAAAACFSNIRQGERSSFAFGAAFARPFAFVLQFLALLASGCALWFCARRASARECSLASPALLVSEMRHGLWFFDSWPHHASAFPREYRNANVVLTWASVGFALSMFVRILVAPAPLEPWCSCVNQRITNRKIGF